MTGRKGNVEMEAKKKGLMLRGVVEN